MPGNDQSRRLGDAERYRALLEIGRKLAGTLSRDDLYEAIHDETARAVRSDGFYIALHDQSRDLARVILYGDRGEVHRVDVPYRGSDSEVIRSQKATLVNSGLAESPLFVLGDARELTVAALTAPLVHHGRVLGVISAQSYAPDVYSEEDLELFQGIADVAAVAIENALQFAELERRRREAEQIEEIGRALTSELDPELVLGKVVDAALEVLDVDGASVWLSDESQAHVLKVAESGGDIVLPVGLEWDIEGEIERVIVDERRPFVVDNLAGNELVPEHVREYLSAGSAVGVPIEVDNQVAGVLTAGSRKPRHFSKYDTSVLQRLARQSSIALTNARLHADLHALSITDPLTHLPNRRRLQIHLDHEVAAARRGRSLALAVFDIDRFKHYNDTFGHVAGDEILKAFAHILDAENRAMNIVARYGGDEFVAALADATSDGIRAYVDRVAQRVRSDDTLAKFGVRVSVGIAQFNADKMATVNDLLRAADADMYANKATRTSHGTVAY